MLQCNLSKEDYLTRQHKIQYTVEVRLKLFSRATNSVFLGINFLFLSLFWNSTTFENYSLPTFIVQNSTTVHVTGSVSEPEPVGPKLFEI